MTGNQEENKQTETAKTEDFPVRWGRVLTFLIGGIILIFLSLLGSHMTRQEVDNEWRQGRKLEKSGKLDKAVAVYQSILTNNPENIKVNLKLGELLIIQKQYKKAEYHIKDVLYIEPEKYCSFGSYG